MSDDCVLLRELLDGKGLSVRWLTQRIGREQAQVYRYLSGEATIPTIVWRALYEKTHDPRIVRLVTGDTPMVVVETPLERPGVDEPTLRWLIEARQKQIEFERALLKILADGRVDGRDARQIAELERQYPAMVRDLTRLYLAVRGQYGKVIGGKTG